jgi:hypothetical protein
VKPPKLSPEQFIKPLRCNVCTFNWMPRRGRGRSRNCPNCGSRRWNWPVAVIQFQDTQKADRDRNRRAAAAKRPA